MENSSNVYDIDNLDREILSILMEDAKTSYSEIARKLIVSPGTIHVRMKKLEDAKAIQNKTLKPTAIAEEDRDYFLERRYPAFGNLVPRDVASRAAKERCDEGYGVNQTGGYKDAVLVSHNHTGSTGGAGGHSHTYTGRSGSTKVDNSGMIGASSYPLGAPTVNTSAVSNHTHSVSVSTQGVSATNRNLPPYYALAYIMRK